ncbi:MAG TPA: endonuclease V [Geobacteraceae bacterium]|nr:endonuclease V [Geobacteraceae bacterium]
MLACVDVAYRDGEAAAACVLFHLWEDGTSACELLEKIRHFAAYRPGEFYRRELPPLLAVLRKVREPLEAVIVDGYVWLDNGKSGLGARLHGELGRSVSVIGVAKNHYVGADLAIPILRGRSHRPLYVTAAGMDAETAARRVMAMHGANRIPTLMKRADSLARRGLNL